MRWALGALAALLALAAGMGSAQAPPQKLALVIGVSDYERDLAAQEAAGFVVPPTLANAVRDAELVAEAFAAQGFAVTRVMNPDKRAMLAAVNAFAGALNRAGPEAVGVFYFAGHGAQGRPALERDVDNYLIPLGADLVTEVDLESEALGLSRVSATLRPGARGAIVLILDACRDFALPAPTRGVRTRGLVEARAAPGTIVAYATSPGAVAVDGEPGRNGPYARSLAAQVRQARGARLEDVFIAVRNDVLEATRSTQVPWENGSLRRAVTLGLAPAAAAGPSLLRPRLSVDRVEGAWVLCWRNSDCPVMIGASPAGLIRLQLDWDGRAQISDTFSAPKAGRWRIESEDVVIEFQDWLWRGQLMTGDCQTGSASISGRTISGAMVRAASRSASECWAMAP